MCNKAFGRATFYTERKAGKVNSFIDAKRDPPSTFTAGPFRRSDIGF
jgi:hypothetical protein